MTAYLGGQLAVALTPTLDLEGEFSEGISWVHRARDCRLGRRVVVRLLAPGLASAGGAVAVLFGNEAKDHSQQTKRLRPDANGLPALRKRFAGLLGWWLCLSVVLGVHVPMLAGQTETPALDSVQISRLASFGRLWGAVRYFHPALALDPTPWDPPVLSAIERIAESHDTTGYRLAIQGALEALRDPVTRVQVVESAVPKPDTSSDPRATWNEDSVLIVTLHDYRRLDDFVETGRRLSRLVPTIAVANRILFDLRATHLAQDGDLNYALLDAGVTGLLTPRPIPSAGQRSRMHFGLKPQDGATSVDFYSAFKTSEGEWIQSTRAVHPKDVIFLVNRHSQVPRIALALQDAALGRIVVCGSVSDESVVQTTSIGLTDGIAVELRLSELVHPDGTIGFQPDAVLPDDSEGLRTTPSRTESASAGQRDNVLDSALRLMAAPHTSHHRASGPIGRAGLLGLAVPDSSYPEHAYPSLSYRVLAAFRFWNAVHLLYPYKHLIREDWDSLLPLFIRQLAQARDSLGYTLGIAKMVAAIHDSHGRTESPTLRGYMGEAGSPALIRFIQGRPVIYRLAFPTEARAAGFVVGDVIIAVNSETADQRATRLRELIPASTPQGLRYHLADYMLSGHDGDTVEVRLGTKTGKVKTVRVPLKKAYRNPWPPEREGPVMRLLPGNIGYADLDRLEVTEVDSMFELFRDTRAIILDMRGYPRGTAWAIAPRLTTRDTVVGFLTHWRVASSPDTTQWTTYSYARSLPTTTKWRYKGRTAMLMDERTQSQAEMTGQFLKAANGTVFIGSRTVGANGNVTNMRLPGGISVQFTGDEKLHPDGGQLQRRGLIPDISVSPTVQGIREDRDEVLERAIKWARAAPRR
jgi:C-terminal processing protease CtpA/Prc